MGVVFSVAAGPTVGASGDRELRPAIDVSTCGRQRDKLREELTLAKIDHHAEAVDELDVEGILAFAERILPRASDLWGRRHRLLAFGARSNQ